MKSVIGLLMLLFSATTALANDYQIFPGLYRPIATSGVNWEFSALVVDVTSGPMYVCNGTMNVLEQTIDRVGIACWQTQIHTEATGARPGAAALSRLEIVPSGPAQVLYPGIWRASNGMVTFCSSNNPGLQIDLYCATTNLP
jgi:hypothetical protein